MIKCPNCGSTAQVKETFSNWSTSLKAQCKSYKCGCGCLFKHVLIKMVKLTENGGQQQEKRSEPALLFVQFNQSPGRPLFYTKTLYLLAASLCNLYIDF